MPTGHAKATVGKTIIADTDTWEEVEGNVYFPPASVKTEYLTKTDHSTHCPWKGDASYYTIKADGESSLEHQKLRSKLMQCVFGPWQCRQGAPERGMVLSHAQGEG